MEFGTKIKISIMSMEHFSKVVQISGESWWILALEDEFGVDKSEGFFYSGSPPLRFGLNGADALYPAFRLYAVNINGRHQPFPIPTL